MISVFLTAALFATPVPCTPVAGADALWREDIRYVFVGETHGTTEAPAAFADLVCAALKQGPVTVSVEYPVQMQPTLDAFMATDSDEAARAALAAFENGPFVHHDGRGSVAMLDLLLKLRGMARDGKDVTLVASVPDSPRVEGFRQSYSEMDRAVLWGRQAMARPQARILILVGRVHAADDREARGVVLAPQQDGKFDGLLALGPVSASESVKP